MAVGVAADGVPRFCELEKNIAPLSRDIGKLVGDSPRGREKRSGELKRVENRNGVLDLVVITAIECQQRSRRMDQLRATQPPRQLLHCKDGIPMFGQTFHLGMKAVAASDLVIAENENVYSLKRTR